MSVTKEEVKSFIRAVRIQQDILIAQTYAPLSTVAVLKDEIEELKARLGDEIDTSMFVTRDELTPCDFTAAEKAILAELASQSDTGFTEADLEDVFKD